MLSVKGEIQVKKKYISPALYYESFSFCGSISAGCEVNHLANTVGACTVNLIPGVDTGEYLFAEWDGSPCTVQTPDMISCSYDVSGESYHVFSS